MSIYSLPTEVSDSMTRYYSLFDDNGELVGTEEELILAQSELDELANKTNETTEWYLKDRANKLAYIAGIQSEIERLQLVVKKEELRIAKVENLLDRIFSRIYEWSKTVIGSFTLSYSKSESCNVEDETKIPKEFIRITPEKIIPESSAPDKVAIKDAIKAGKEVPGASILVKNTLKIK